VLLMLLLLLLGGGGDGGSGVWAATNAFSCPSIAMINKIDRLPLS